MEKLTEQDKKRCIEFLKSFIDEGRTGDELMGVCGFIFSSVHSRIDVLTYWRNYELRNMPFMDIVAKLPDLSKTYDELRYSRPPQDGIAAGEACQQKPSEQK